MLHCDSVTTDPSLIQFWIPTKIQPILATTNTTIIIQGVNVQMTRSGLIDHHSKLTCISIHHLGGRRKLIPIKQCVFLEVKESPISIHLKPEFVF